MKQDIQVLLSGGSLPHTGAVAVYKDGQCEGVIQPEGHKEQVIAEKWSRILSEKSQERVTTLCGIHYDNLKPDEIQQVLSVTDEMLEEVLARFSIV
jgi:hypothetical protein